MTREDDEHLLDALTARAKAEANLTRAEHARDTAEDLHARAEAALAGERAAREEATRLQGVAEAAHRRASFLSRTTRRMAASMDYEATLREVVSSAIPFVADWALVTLTTPAGGRRIIGFGHHDSEREDLVATFAGAYEPAAGSSITATLQTGQPQMVNDLTDAQLQRLAPDPRTRELLQTLGLRHFGTWPIPAGDGDRPQGALSLIRGPHGAPFTGDDRVLAETVATRAGLHLTNARLHTERSEIAAALQQGLLPRALPAIPGVELAVSFLPAGEHNIIGGDFFDVLADAGGQWTVMLGDVAGKGPHAAAVTATARHTLRTAALLDPDPVRNLALLDRVLDSDGQSDQRRFCSAILARVDPSDAGLRVELASGGHPYPLIARRDGTLEAVEDGRGPLVGIGAGGNYSATSRFLNPGDKLILFTDGLTEIRGQAPDFGEHQLLAGIRAHAHSGAQQLADALSRHAVELQGDRPRDDIAVLVIAAPAHAAV